MQDKYIDYTCTIGARTSSTYMKQPDPDVFMRRPPDRVKNAAKAVRAIHREIGVYIRDYDKYADVITKHCNKYGANFKLVSTILGEFR